MPSLLTVRNLALSALILLLQACGLSPQLVDITPSPQVEYSAYGANAAVNVLVRDERPNDELGSRGGTYPDTSLLLINNDLPKEVYEAITKGLHQQGFNVLNPDNRQRQLTVFVDELFYTPAEGTVVNGVTVQALVRAEVHQADELIYSNRYRSETEHKMPVTPSTSKNTAYINSELTRTLERLLNDKRLLEALKEGRD